MEYIFSQVEINKYGFNGLHYPSEFNKKQN